MGQNQNIIKWTIILMSKCIFIWCSSNRCTDMQDLYGTVHRNAGAARGCIITPNSLIISTNNTNDAHPKWPILRRLEKNQCSEMFDPKLRHAMRSIWITTSKLAENAVVISSKNVTHFSTYEARRQAKTDMCQLFRGNGYTLNFLKLSLWQRPLPTT